MNDIDLLSFQKTTKFYPVKKTKRKVAWHKVEIHLRIKNKLSKITPKQQQQKKTVKK